MPPRKTAKDFFSKGRERGSDRCQKGIDGSVILKRTTPKVERDYQRMLDLWKQFAQDHAEDNPDPFDLKSLKDFVKEIAFSIDGAGDDPNPAGSTVLVYWKQFMAGWRRVHDAIPPNVTLSVTNFIKYELPEVLKEESSIRMVHNKRQRRFGTKNHFVQLGQQLWGNDWVEYGRPATRVHDWAILMANVCSSSRIGEYIESSCRANSGRGLYYKNVEFGVFRNEDGNAEFAVQITRDAKGMTYEPDKRPQHVIYEGLAAMPLLCNGMLPILAIAIAAKAFRDCDTIEDLLALEPVEGAMLHLQWKDSVLEQPFFKTLSSRRAQGKIETAGALSKRLRALGLRAGYINPPTIHDFRAEGLYWIDQFYSIAQRMKHAGHKDSRTYNVNYQPNNSGTDGQGSYFGGEVRTVVNDLFRGTTVSHNPQLSQCLPAEMEEALVNSTEYVAVQTELAALRGLKDPAAAKRRTKLYGVRKALRDQELRKWQKSQPNCLPKSGKESMPPPSYHRDIFNRVRFLMPQRDRLASTLLETHTLRSPTGLEALRDMVALCEADAEVVVRPGLEPSKCQCADATRRRKLPRCGESGINSQNIRTYDWKHVYQCFKEAHSGFTEFCFLCSLWVHGEAKWAEHCSEHLACPEQLPAQCDPLMYGGVLATAGYCIFCIAEASLPPEERLHQFQDKRAWQQHVYGHYSEYVQTIGNEKLMRCPHPGICYDTAFDSVQQFKFHVLDCHCRDLIDLEGLNMVESSSKPEDVEFTPPCKRNRKSKAEAAAQELKVKRGFSFVDETVGLVRHYGPGDMLTASPFEDPVYPTTPYSSSYFDVGDALSSIYPSP
ncbi:hypothetical protein FJTKL_04930 [Diaporthe vaccinii]|uniref:C2H2-type domain-containing protein n=1 Tax=Diaporthe vaccinii TaxID=105482 RepID=A0ABR4DRU4_9PEZI